MTWDPPTPQNGLPADRGPDQLPLWVVILLVVVIGGLLTRFWWNVL